MKKSKTRMFLVGVAITVALGLSLNPGSVKALSLADLIQPGAFLIIDDKKFSNFLYAGSASGGAIAIPAAGIDVMPIATVLNPGMQFSAAWAAGPGETMDSLIMYQVDVLPGGVPIKDISASMANYGISGQSIVSVAETAQWPGGSGALLLHLNGGLLDYAELDIDPPTMGPIVVVKDIAVNGVDGIAVVSSVTNQFSEGGSVPEPTTMLLLGSGLIGLAGYGKKKLFKK